ncbi:hypothetical protein [Pantoea sp. JKS000250]|uniref:hypothetical protein n=1 Tax=Pantoea sp. JKS000250 TaxID=1938795 RepID=UPI000D75A277|nr:hypothetical protein [Pantoea sp. JKS000250]PXW19017.1 hypothetical protein BY447_0584 [Pantoea sp. JKS000250]
MNKELAEAVKLFISQPLNNPLSRGQMMEIARIALPILEQQERGEGEWIEWGGGECPVKGATLVDIKFRNGDIIRGYKPRHLDWRLDGDIGDIIAYRIIPERATNQNGEQ